MTTTQRVSIPHPTERGILRSGTVIDGIGTIVRVSHTAYEVEIHDGDRFALEWISFDQVHGRPAPAMPLVVFA